MKEGRMLKKNITLVNRKGLNHIAKKGGNPVDFKPWLGDTFSFFYDFIMKSSLFPKKLQADIGRHNEILSEMLRGVRGKRVLELATGSGSAVNFLPNNNHYTGTDISPGLLKIAVKRFRKAGFRNAAFYVTGADDLPFEDNSFDVVLCILSLNFFGDVDKVLREVKRVGASGAPLVCSVPVPERNKARNKIRGTLHPEEALASICKGNGMAFEAIPAENGALLYFKAVCL